jgi:hypothetical protein
MGLLPQKKKQEIDNAGATKAVRWRTDVFIRWQPGTVELSLALVAYLVCWS